MSISDLIELLGGLTLFLYGMKVMSEALQHVAGSKLKGFLSNMTKNRFAALLSGIGITVAIQSSSATTVMLVGFVNAGLVTMEHSIGVIMGANIGTTITAWMVALLGFKVKISSFSLPAIVMGVLMLFSASERLKSWSPVLIGFGLMFLGLSYLKGAVPDSAKSPDAYAFLSSYAGEGIGSMLFFVFIGTLLTIVVQSSSATSAITITMAFNGLIDEKAAFCMILGENIGTTVTANLAAITANLNSKKTAVAHSVFNLIGVTWVLLVFQPFSDFVSIIMPPDPLLDPKDTVHYRIAAFHTIFNVTNTTILIWFAPNIAKLVNAFLDRIVLRKKSAKASRYQLFRAGSIQVSELAFAELEEHMRRLFADHLYSVRKTWPLVNKKYDAVIHGEILEAEKDTDEIRNNILGYLHNIQVQTMSPDTSRRIHILSQQVKMVEEVSDLCARLARKSKKANNLNVQASEEDSVALDNLLNSVDKQLQILVNLFTDSDFEEEHIGVSLGSLRKVQKSYKSIEKSLVNKMRGNKKVKILNEFYLVENARTIRDLSRNLHYLIALLNE